jgi:hypothetical protein
MMTTKSSVLDTLQLIKENFDNILTIENFSLLEYNPFDLSSYDEKKKTFDETNTKEKKDVKEDDFFKPTKSTPKKEEKNCSNNIFDTSCYTGLKIGIWFLILFTIIFICVFIWYIIRKMYQPQQALQMHVLEPLPQMQPPQMPSREIPIEISSDTWQTNTSQTQPSSTSFMSRIFGSKSSLPTPVPETDFSEKDDFVGRLIGNKQQLPRQPKESFVRRLLGQTR